MSTETPIEDVNSLLAEIKTQLSDDQDADDLKNATNEAICEKNIQSYENNIDYHTQGLASNEDLLTDTQDLLQTAQDNHDQTIDDLSSNNERYSDGETTRGQENSDYLQKVQDYEDALSAVAEAQQLVQSLQSGALFIQLKSKFVKITAKLKEHKSKHILYQPIIKSMAELASRADQDTIKKILQLLQNLVDALNEGKSSEDATEVQQVEDWDQMSKDLLDERQTLTQKKQSLEESIESYKKIIADAEEKITQHTNELDSNRNLLAQQESWCEEVSENYVSNSVER
jgi:hypothetical protein